MVGVRANTSICSLNYDPRGVVHPSHSVTVIRVSRSFCSSLAVAANWWNQQQREWMAEIQCKHEPWSHPGRVGSCRLGTDIACRKDSHSQQASCRSGIPVLAVPSVSLFVQPQACVYVIAMIMTLWDMSYVEFYMFLCQPASVTNKRAQYQ